MARKQAEDDLDKPKRQISEIKSKHEKTNHSQSDFEIATCLKHETRAFILTLLTILTMLLGRGEDSGMAKKMTMLWGIAMSTDIDCSHPIFSALAPVASI